MADGNKKDEVIKEEGEEMTEEVTEAWDEDTKQEEDGESPAGSSARKCETISQDPKLQMVNERPDGSFLQNFLDIYSTYSFFFP